MSEGEVRVEGLDEVEDKMARAIDIGVQALSEADSAAIAVILVLQPVSDKGGAFHGVTNANISKEAMEEISKSFIRYAVLGPATKASAHAIH